MRILILMDYYSNCELCCRSYIRGNANKYSVLCQTNNTLNAEDAFFVFYRPVQFY